MRSQAVERLKECFARLPGIGSKTSERLTYHLLAADEREAMELAEAIRKARESTKVCRTCFGLDEIDPCSVCSDESRDQTLLMVVEHPREVAVFEQAGYRGRYHVLQGRVSSLEGIGPEDLTVAQLLRRLRGSTIQEVCLATNPDLEGEATEHRDVSLTLVFLNRGSKRLLRRFFLAMVEVEADRVHLAGNKIRKILQ